MIDHRILRLEFSSLQYVGSALNQVPILSYHPEFESCTGQWYQQTPENIYSLDWKPAGSCRKPSAPCFFYTSTQGQPKGQDHSLRFLVELISHVHELKISAGIPNVDAEVLITRCKWSYNAKTSQNVPHWSIATLDGSNSVSKRNTNVACWVK